MKKLSSFLLVTLFALSAHSAFGQTTYKETMGTVPGTTAIASHTGWTYYGILNYSGSADVRATTQSNVTDYSQASGGANVFFTNIVGREFTIAGINTNTFTNFDKISFGMYKSTTVSNGSELILEYTTDNGSSWTAFTKPTLPTGSGTAKWYYITTSAVIFPTDTNLTIRFRQTSSAGVQFRIDDVTLIGDGALPVELASFSSSVSSRQVTLFWITASEINNHRFEIERKNNDEWKTVGTVMGHGTSNQQHEYTFPDAELNSGSYQYRLKQIDFNGNHEYHNLPGDVIIEKPQKISLKQNYPNPCNPTTQISFDLSENGYVSLKIFDIIGKKVATLIDKELTADFYNIEFDVSNLASGTYFYTLTAGSFKSIKKMTVVK